MNEMIFKSEDYTVIKKLSLSSFTFGLSIDCCLEECVQVAEIIVIAYTENEVHFKEFIKGCQ